MRQTLLAGQQARIGQVRVKCKVAHGSVCPSGSYRVNTRHPRFDILGFCDGGFGLLRIKQRVYLRDDGKVGI